MKKVISLITAITILLSFSALQARAEVSEEEGIISLLKELEIMQGDENGDMMLDKKVSRAEFAKIAIAASPQKNTVAVGLKQSPFKDVPYTTWYAPYIKAAVSAGYVVGYLDATFKPENTVTYEEAATILIRVLGYDDSTFSAAYPYGQLSKAQGLDLLDDVDGEMGEELTRRQVMRMVYNALDASMSSGGKLLTVHETAMTENTDIIATENEDDSLGADKVYTSAGTYTKGDYFDDASAGMTGTIYTKNGKDLISFVPDKNKEDEDGYETYFVYSILSNSTIVGYRDGKFEEIDIPDSTSAYQNQQRTTYSMIKNSLEMGDTLFIKRTKNGSVDYVTYDSNNLAGPVKVTGDGWRTQIGASSSSKVFRSGVESTASAVSVNDIIYYSEPLDVVFAYTDKTTGIYEKASPTKDSPTSVTVSGKEYKIESVDAFNDLSSSGSYKYGDTVTLLLGRDGEVAGVAGRTGETTAAIGTSTNTSSSTTAGFVIETGKKDFTNADDTVHTGYYAKVVNAEGITYEYETKTNYSSLVCSAVTIKFTNGKATLSRTSNKSLSGVVSVKKGMIGGLYVSDDVKILDTLGSDKTDVPTYKRIYLQRLEGTTLKVSQIRYYSQNSAGEIDELILKDVTGDMYTYGIVTKSNKARMVISDVTKKETITTIEKDDDGEKTTVSENENKIGVESTSYNGSYTAYVNGAEQTYGTNLSFTLNGPCRLLIDGNSIIKAQQIGAYNGLVSKLTQTEATINGNEYLLSDNTVVYLQPKGTFTYMKIPIDDAISSSYKMTAYYDKAQSSGGRIRLIIAQEK